MFDGINIGSGCLPWVFVEETLCAEHCSQSFSVALNSLKSTEMVHCRKSQKCSIELISIFRLIL